MKPQEPQKEEWETELKRQCENRNLPYQDVHYLASQALASTRTEVLEEVERRIEKLKPVLWNDNTNRYLENVAKYNVLNELSSSLKNKI